jgi:hypothetical protein
MEIKAHMNPCFILIPGYLIGLFTTRSFVSVVVISIQTQSACVTCRFHYVRGYGMMHVRQGSERNN